MGRGAQWRAEAGVDPMNPGPDIARQMIQAYLSAEHLGDLDGQCPMIALPSDVARANLKVQSSYQGLLEAMVGLFENGLNMKKPKPNSETRQQALSLAALCVGGMVLARSMPDSVLAEEIRLAAYHAATEMAVL